MLSRNLEQTLHRALALATERRHEYATLEHLLLALTDDQDAIAVLRACGVDLDELRRSLSEFIESELVPLDGSQASEPVLAQGQHPLHTSRPVREYERLAAGGIDTDAETGDRVVPARVTAFTVALVSECVDTRLGEFQGAAPYKLLATGGRSPQASHQ